MMVGVHYLEAAEVVRCISLAVAHLHHMDIAHRDLKVCHRWTGTIVTALNSELSCVLIVLSQCYAHAGKFSLKFMLGYNRLRNRD